MKKPLTMLASATFMFVAGIGTAIAQEDEGPRAFAPIELFACNYNDGKGMEDFDKAVAMLESASNAEGGEPYAAFRLARLFYGPQQEFDFLYVGAWPNGSTMGRDYDNYFATGEDTVEAWNDAVTCGAAVVFASTMLKATPNDGPPGEFILTVSDCDVTGEGDVLGALEAYSDWRTEAGSPGGTWAWFPAYGGGGEEFAFKLVNSHETMGAFGNHFQWYAESQAYLKVDETMGDLVSCDAARVYIGETLFSTIPQDG